MSRALLKTEAIVLSEIRHKDTSKILNIYTKKYGKIGVMAQGAYKPKSKLIASTGSFSHSELCLQRSGEFYYINQADLIDSFYSIRENMNRMFYGYYLLELMDKSTPLEEENEKLFLLLEKGLKILSNMDKNYLRFILSYELKFISFLGYRPNMSNCVICSSDENYNIRFSIEQGGLICNNCFQKDFASIAFDNEMYIAYNQLLFAPLDLLEEINIDMEVLKRLHKLIVNYILYNIDRSEFKSLDLLDSLEDM